MCRSNRQSCQRFGHYRSEFTVSSEMVETTRIRDMPVNGLQRLGNSIQRLPISRAVIHAAESSVHRNSVVSGALTRQWLEMNSAMSHWKYLLAIRKDWTLQIQNQRDRIGDNSKTLWFLLYLLHSSMFSFLSFFLSFSFFACYLGSSAIVGVQLAIIAIRDIYNYKL
jgi:hypothetical protein